MQIVFPLYTGFTALDAVGPYEVLLRLPGAEVIFAAERPGDVLTDRGALALRADRAFDALPSPDIVVVPGGPMAVDPELHGPLIAWLKAVHPTTTWTCSVCTGSLMLAAAGILDGVEATTHWAATGALAKLGATPVKRRVVMAPERRVVTAAGVSSGIDMALELSARIAGPMVAQALQLGLEYDPAPPFDAGHPDKAAPEVVSLVRSLLQ